MCSCNTILCVDPDLIYNKLDSMKQSFSNTSELTKLHDLSNFFGGEDALNSPTTDMSNFRQLADFRLFCLVLGHSCESSRSGLIFTSVWGGGGGVSLGPYRILHFLLNTK